MEWDVPGLRAESVDSLKQLTAKSSVNRCEIDAREEHARADAALLETWLQSRSTARRRPAANRLTASTSFTLSPASIAALSASMSRILHARCRRIEPTTPCPAIEPPPSAFTPTQPYVSGNGPSTFLHHGFFSTILPGLRSLRSGIVCESAGALGEPSRALGHVRGLCDSAQAARRTAAQRAAQCAQQYQFRDSLGGVARRSSWF